MLRHMEASITFDRNRLVFRNRLCYILHTIERARTCIKYFTVAMSHRFNQNMAFVCVCVFLNCSLLPFLFPHFPFNVFTSYLIILPHRKRQTFICIFLVNIYIHLSVGLNGVHSAMNLELCSLTQSLAHAPIFLPIVSMSDIIRLCMHCIHIPFCVSFAHTLRAALTFFSILFPVCATVFTM